MQRGVFTFFHRLLIKISRDSRHEHSRRMPVADDGYLSVQMEELLPGAPGAPGVTKPTAPPTTWLVRYLQLKRSIPCPWLARIALGGMLLLLALSAVEYALGRTPTLEWSWFMLWNFVRGRGSKMGWFLSDLPPASVVAQWNDTQLDLKLHGLSRWNNFSHSEWRAFVMAQIRPLRLDANATFHFLEVGMGVGAFSREILGAFPHATGHGFDLVPRAIEIASVVLPQAKMKVTVGDMVDIHEPSESFDLVFVPGALCYLSSMDLVRTAVAGFSRVLRKDGGLCIHMIASENSPKGSCVVRIPKAFWTEDVLQKPFGLKLIAMEEMSSWGLEHALGRYAVCLRKVGGGDPPSAV